MNQASNAIPVMYRVNASTEDKHLYKGDLTSLLLP